RLLALGAGGRSTASPVRFVGRARPPAAGGVLSFPGERDEEVRLAPLPFVHPNALLEAFDVAPERWTANYTDQVRIYEERLGDGLAEGFDPNRHVLLFAAHLHVGGARFSGSERMVHCTDGYATTVEHLPAVSYAAFGHIHRPQALPGGRARGRYAGSPIAVDFGEAGEPKGVVTVEARPGRVAAVQAVPLGGGRPLRRLAGTLEALAAQAAGVGRAIISVTAETAEPTPDLAERVAALFPEAAIFDVVERCPAFEVSEASPAPPGAVEPPVRDLFRDYLAATPTPAASVDRLMGTFGRLLDAAEAQAEPFFDEEALFVPPAAGAVHP
ncbi:MAG: exonuclease SbcCD subunit D, partial [Acidimicrobiales bacterium]